MILWDCLGLAVIVWDWLGEEIASSLFFSWIMAIQFAWQEDDLGCLYIEDAFRLQTVLLFFCPPADPRFCLARGPAPAAPGVLVSTISRPKRNIRPTLKSRFGFSHSK